MREAQPADITTLVELMREFYSESGYTLDSSHAQTAVEELLSDARLGRIWIIDHDSVGVGYVVVTFAFAMEYGGLVAFVDDFFVRPAFRSVGLGTAALTAARGTLSVRGVRAMFVEVAGDNDPALPGLRPRRLRDDGPSAHGAAIGGSDARGIVVRRHT